MRVDVIARRAADDADVRLRLGPVAENDRTLCLDEPSLSERPLHRFRHEKHRRPARAVLRLLHQQQPIEQLDRVVLVEEAVVDQPPVLMAGPATQAEASGARRPGPPPAAPLARPPGGAPAPAGATPLGPP